ncbi:O-antigen ligase family protein [Microbacterium sp. P5_E9]
MSTGLLLGVLGPVAVVLIVVGVLAQPLIVGGLIAAAAVAFAACLIPERILVGVAGSISILLVTLSPIHLVPSQLRYGQLMVIAVLAIVVLIRRRGTGTRAGGPLLLVAYLAVTIFSSVAYGIDDSVFQVLTLHTLVPLSFVVFGLKSTRAERKTMAGTLIFIASAQALYGIAEVILEPPVLWASPVPDSFASSDSRLANEIVPGLPRAQGSFGHPLLYGFTLIIATALIREYSFARRGMRFALTVLMFAGAVAAGSRSAVLVMAAVVLFSIGSRKFRVLRGVLLAGVVLAFAAASGFFGSEVVDRFTSSGSLTHRQGIWENIPYLLAQPFEHLLLGNGWIRVGDVYDLRILPPTDGFRAIDNQYIATFITSGLLGFVLLMLTMVVSIVRARGAVRLGLLATTVVFFVFDVLEFPATWSLLALLIGFAATKDGGEITAEDPALHHQGAITLPLEVAERATPAAVRYPARARVSARRGR